MEIVTEFKMEKLGQFNSWISFYVRLNLDQKIIIFRKREILIIKFYNERIFDMNLLSKRFDSRE